MGSPVLALEGDTLGHIGTHRDKLGHITMFRFMFQLGRLLLLSAILSATNSVPRVPLPDWKEFPLTIRDVKLIKVGGDIPITTNTINQTCPLTPEVEEGSGSICTWRTSQECTRIPTIIKVPVYSPWCTEEGQGARLTNCKETVRTVPIVHSVRVCTPTGSPDCRGPCYNCDQYCEQRQQEWCEVSHSISTLVSDKRECREVEERECEDVLKRVEKDEVKSNENCYQKDVELCGPVNCKFVNLTMECHEKNSTMLVELRESECTVCEPTLAENVKVEQVCQEVLTDDCNSDPLNRRWKKFCGVEEESNLVDSKMQFKFEDIEEPRSQNNLENNKFSVEDLIYESLAPVNNLVFETLKQIHVEDINASTPIVIITEKPQEISSEGVTGILKLIELEEESVKEEVLALKELQSNPTTINVNVQFDPTSSDFSRAPSSPVYFDQIFNTLRKQTEFDKITSTTSKNPSNSSPSSLTEVLDLQLQSQFLSTPTTQTTKNPKKNIPEELEITTWSPKTTETSRTQEQSISDPTLQTSSVLAPEPLSTTLTTTTRIATTTTTIRTPEISKTTESVPSPRKLSAAEFLRLCFISHTGCDFSQNEIESRSRPETEVERTTTRTLTSLVTTQVPTTRKPETPRKPKNIQERLKQRVKLCFFSGLCNENDLNLHTTRRPTTTTTTPRQTTTANSRSREIQRRVQERARACFFEGKCN